MYINQQTLSNNTLHSIYPLESNKEVSLYYLLGLINSRLMNWYYQIENYLEMGKPMAEVKGVYIRKLPIAVGSKEQIKGVEDAVAKLLDLCQKKYDKKYNFIRYIQKSYEPKKITEKLEDFEDLSYKKFVEELKKQKVKLSASQQMDLLNLYDGTINEIDDMNKRIEILLYELDMEVFDIYKIPDETVRKIMN